MDKATFVRKVEERKESMKVTAWIDLPNNCLQLISIEKKNSRYGECFLGTSRDKEAGVNFLCWFSNRFVKEIERRYTAGDSIYWMPLGCEKKRQDGTRRNLYEIEFQEDEDQIPLSKIINNKTED